jgi:tetraacyldisaccharide 4'-kinase
VLLLRKLLFPISLLYGLVVHIRNWCYDRGFFHCTGFSVPIICVGNLSVGGTGKTPMVEYLLQGPLADSRVAVLSRGYKRRSKGFVLASAESTVEDLGDEPYQIFKKFNGRIAVAVEADRAKGVQLLMDTVRPEVVLMDDAYQHRRVTPLFTYLIDHFR